MTPRVVLDTNIVVSSLVFQQGRLSWVRADWMAARFLPLVSKPTLEEVFRVLAYPKFQLREADIAALVSDYLPFTESVAMPESPPSVPEPPDPDDRIFLELAQVGRAGYLVTGDRGLLEVGSVGPCLVVTAEGFRIALSEL